MDKMSLWACSMVHKSRNVKKNTVLKVNIYAKIEYLY